MENKNSNLKPEKFNNYLLKYFSGNFILCLFATVLSAGLLTIQYVLTYSLDILNLSSDISTRFCKGFPSLPFAFWPKIEFVWQLSSWV